MVGMIKNGVQHGGEGQNPPRHVENGVRCDKERLPPPRRVKIDNTTERGPPLVVYG
jgi:hypothetical protein